MADRTVTIIPSGGDYTSLATALTTEYAAYPDLTDDNGSGGEGALNFAISGDWSAAADAVAVVPAFVTSATYRVNIYTDAANRASLAWDDDKYRIAGDPGSGHGLIELLNIDYVWIDGIQAAGSAADSGRHAIAILGDSRVDNTNATWISRCLLKAVGGSRSTCHGIFVDGNYADAFVWNSAVYNVRAGGTSYAVLCNASGGSLTIGSSTLSGGVYGLYRYAGTCVAKNVYAGGSSSGDFNGTITKTTCASSDTTGSAGLQEIPVSTATFVNVTAGTEDWHLAEDSALIGVGTDTSGDAAPMDFSDDIDGDAR